MFDKTRNDVKSQYNKVKQSRKEYADRGRQHAKDMLRSREDEHKDEYLSPSEFSEQYFRNRRDDFKNTSHWKQLGILVIFLIVAFLIILGWLA